MTFTGDGALRGDAFAQMLPIVGIGVGDVQRHDAPMQREALT